MINVRGTTELTNFISSPSGRFEWPQPYNASVAPIPKPVCFRRSAPDEGTPSAEHEAKDDEVKPRCRRVPLLRHKPQNTSQARPAEGMGISVTLMLYPSTTAVWIC